MTAMARSFSRLTLAGKILFTMVPILLVVTGGLVVLVLVAGKPVVDFLAAVMDGVGATQVTVLSAYRTRETNAMLARTSFGVADNSQHIYGRALDIRLPSRTEDAMQAARAMRPVRRCSSSALASRASVSVRRRSRSPRLFSRF